MQRLATCLPPRVAIPVSPPLQSTRPMLHVILCEIDGIVPRVRNPIATPARCTLEHASRTYPMPPLGTRTYHQLRIPTPNGNTLPVSSSTPLQTSTNTNMPSCIASYPTRHLIPNNDAYRSSASGDYIAGGIWIEPDDIPNTISQRYHLCLQHANCTVQDPPITPLPTHARNSVLDKYTGNLLKYRHLIKGPDRRIWLKALANDLGHLA